MSVQGPTSVSFAVLDVDVSGYFEHVRRKAAEKSSKAGSGRRLSSINALGEIAVSVMLARMLATFALLACTAAAAIEIAANPGAWGLYSGAESDKPLGSFGTAEACVAGAGKLGKTAAYTCRAAVAGAPVASGSPAPGSSVTAWVLTTTEGNAFDANGPVRYGDGSRWITKMAAGTASCTVDWFSGDPAYGVAKFCERQVTAPAVAQVPGQMPVINRALVPPPGESFNATRVVQLTAAQLADPVYQSAPSDVGAFRTVCGTATMGFFDPIVYPGQVEAGHFHTFQGNAAVSGASTADSLATTGNSTCSGGTLNRTSYWMPTLIDIRTGQPLVPSSTIFYYKTGYLGVKPAAVVAPPRGLRMIAGDSKGTTPIPSEALWRIGLECVSGGGHQTSIPSCAVGDDLNVSIIFPQCWDGKNLDSPDHKSHMAYATGNGCPSTHPVAIPEIALNTHYRISEADSGRFLRLSSDTCSGFGGCSTHADWFMAWDEATIKAFVVNCLNASRDCHANLLGDGRMLY